MLYLHLFVTGKPILLNTDNILLVEEIEVKNDEESSVSPTQIWLKQALPTEDAAPFVHVQESVEWIAKRLKAK